MQNSEYREPFWIDENGLYITKAQMTFYLLRLDEDAPFKTTDIQFINYYKNCCIYNVIYDMMEIDPECAQMYWDVNKQHVSLSFPVRGSVAEALAEVSLTFGDDFVPFRDNE